MTYFVCEYCGNTTMRLRKKSAAFCTCFGRRRMFKRSKSAYQKHKQAMTKVRKLERGSIFDIF